MRSDELSRFTDFRHLEPVALRELAAASRRLRLPPRRWLVRPGRTFGGAVYLLDGRVRLLDGERTSVVNAGSARAARPIYPGPGAVQTLTTCSVLSVPVAWLDAWQAAPGAGLGAPQVVAEDGCWQHRFLGTPLMQHLRAHVWQRVLRAMTAADHDAGDWILRRGERSGGCFVLGRGAAQVLGACGEVLATLTPGSLFGEDALITDGPRNASVRMQTGGRVMCLGAEDFRRSLLDEVAAPLAEAGERRLVALVPGAGGITVAGAALRQAGRALSAGHRYGIVGGRLTERQLAAFLLAEQGIDARPLA